jgi:hypothetical protein
MIKYGVLEKAGDGMTEDRMHSEGTKNNSKETWY